DLQQQCARRVQVRLQPLRLEKSPRDSGAGEHVELRLSEPHGRTATHLPAGGLPEHVHDEVRPQRAQDDARHKAGRRVPPRVVHAAVVLDLAGSPVDPPCVTPTATYHPLGRTPDGPDGIMPGGTLYQTGLRDHNNVAPRVGFTYNVTEKSDLVIRGGTGFYYNVPDSNTTFSQQSFNGVRILVNSFPNDQRPGFIADPTRGRTGQDFISGKYPLPAQNPRVIAHDYKMPYTWQSVLGFQK